MSHEIRHFLAIHAIAQSRTNPYNPQGNGQCERYNGILWKSILLALKTRNRHITKWEMGY
jgi:transposase InsO family protein